MRVLVGLIAAVVIGGFKGGAQPPAEPVPVQPRPVPRAAALGDALGFLPGDAQVVAVLDFKEVRTSVLWQRFEPTLQHRFGTYKAAFKDCYQFDPLSTIRRMSVGVSDIRGNPRGVVVIHGFRRDLVMKCFDAVVAGSQGKIVKLANGVLSYDDGSTRAMVTFADDLTMVVQFGPQTDAVTFAATLDGGAPLRMSPEFGELLGRVDPAHPMWLVVQDGSLFTGVTAGANATSLMVSARIGDSAAALMRMRFSDPAQAGTLATQFQGQLGPLQIMVEEVTVVADDADLVVTVRMSSAQLDAILGLLGPSLGITP